MARTSSKAKCRTTGQVRFTKRQVERLERITRDRYKWCEFCHQYHRIVRDRLVDKP